jgi:hypothetical protein
MVPPHFVSLLHPQEILSPLVEATPANKKQIAAKLAKVEPRGGTALAAGLKAGLKVLTDAGPAPAAAASPASAPATKAERRKAAGTTAAAILAAAPASIGQTHSKRVFFLTDMESSMNDEAEVLAAAVQHATARKSVRYRVIARANFSLQYPPLPFFSGITV